MILTRSKRTILIAALLCLITQLSVGVWNEKAVADDSKSSSSYLFVWAGDDDQKDDDFLAVIDSNPGSKSYGQVITTMPVGVRTTSPHHTEYEFPAGAKLFANGWGAGRTFIIDLTSPTKPILSGQFTTTKDFAFPHSFARLPNGNVLATFQVGSKSYEPPGGLVELDGNGKLLRARSASVPNLDKKLLWPYSLEVLPQIDRVVTTSTEMGLPSWTTPHSSGMAKHEHTLTDTRHIQIWSLKDLRLLATIPLPPAPDGRSHLNPAEPRVLPDGSVYVNTFNCGLYRLLGLSSAAPTAEFVWAFPGANTKFECAVPVVIGRYWIQTDPSLPGLVALDISDPAKPTEASRIVFDQKFEKSHWVAADRSGNRVVVTGNNRSWVLIVAVDNQTGKLTLDEKFGSVDFDRPEWPHGKSGKAVVHGALFWTKAK